MEYEPASQFGNDLYADRTLIFPRINESRVPRFGTILYDDHAPVRLIRPYQRVDLNFPPLYARHIARPILSDEFIVHDSRHIYVDSSIHVAGSAGAEIDRVADRMARGIALCAGPPIDQYAEESALVLHNEGGGTWGHFLIQNFPRALLYLRHFPQGRIVVPHRDTQSRNNNFARLFAMFGIPPTALLGVERGRSYRFRELILLDFPFDFSAQAAHPEALALLQSAGPNARSRPAGRMFVERIAGSGTRSIENLAGLRPTIARHGFPMQTLGVRPVQHQAGWWRSSGLVVATLGSDLANIVFGEPGTDLLVLSPDWFGDTFFYQLAMAKGMRWNELRCGRRGEAAEIDHRTNFWVDEVLLDSMLGSLVQG